MKPFGPLPEFKIGDRVRLSQKPERIRKVLKIEWHMHRYQWVYIIETSACEKKNIFEPYWFANKLESIIIET